MGTAIVIDICKNTNVTINPTPTATPTSTATPKPTQLASNLKVPRLQNLFLTKQGPKLAPRTCAESSDVAIFTHQLSNTPKSINAKGELQRVAALSFEVRFDPKDVCVNIEPGQYVQETGMTCFILDKDTSQLKGLARIACVFKGKSMPSSSSLELARVFVRPQPELYSQLIPNQGNGIAVQLLNQGCELADAQGHPIPSLSCDDADLTIRFLEGDINSDCNVDVLDQAQLAMRWGAGKGHLNYNQRMDLAPSGTVVGGFTVNGDGRIDVMDLQFVYGRHRSACDDPHPPQPPVSLKGPKVTPSPTATATRTPTPTGMPKPRINKFPQQRELLLSTPPDTKRCRDGRDTITFEVVIKDPISSPSPKNPAELQQLGAFEFETRFDPFFVCIQISPGNIPNGEMTCFTSEIEGLVRFGCATKTKETPPTPQPPGVLAVISVRPQPDLYALLVAPGEEVVTQLLNQDCKAADLQGHPIKIAICGDATVIIRRP